MIDGLPVMIMEQEFQVLQDMRWEDDDAWLRSYGSLLKEMQQKPLRLVKY